MVTSAAVQTEDLVPVRSRISWSAILAGAVLTLSLYFFLALLGGAIVFSISDKVSAQGLGIGATIYSLLVTAGCLMIGGYVASQLTTGENHLEGALYGIFVWAAVFVSLLTLTTMGARVGFEAISGVATAQRSNGMDWEASARQGGVPQEQIDQWKQRANNAGAAAQDPQNQRAAADTATRAAWYSFLGVWVSMMAAAAGGYLGSGPNIKFFAVSLNREGREGRPVISHA